MKYSLVPLKLLVIVNTHIIRGHWQKFPQRKNGHNMFSQKIYRTRGIITRGLYNFTHFLKVKNVFSRSFFSENSAFKYGQYSRAVCNQERDMMARVRQIMNDTKYLLNKSYRFFFIISTTLRIGTYVKIQLNKISLE